MRNANSYQGHLVCQVFLTPIFGFVLLAILFSNQIYAITITLKDTIFVTSEIIVEAQRPRQWQQSDDYPGLVAILPLSERSSQVSTAADYLSSAVGCYVKSTGGYGAYSTASIRGASAKQVRVYIDGIPLPQSQSGVIDLGNLPINSIERIEIYRGFGPNDLSGSSIGGMINLVTRSPSKENWSFSTLYASHETARFECTYSKIAEKFDMIIASSFLTTKGNYRFLDNNGTPYNPDDDQWVRRLNNDLSEQDALVKITSQLKGINLIASNQFYHREQGLPGYASFQSTTQRMRRLYNLTHLALKSHSRSNPSAELDAYYMYQNDCFEDRRPKVAGVKPDEENNVGSVGLSLKIKTKIPILKQWIRTTLSVSNENYQPYETFEKRIKGERQSRIAYSFNLEEEIGLLGGKIRLFPSLRSEHLIDRTKPFETIRKDLVAYNRSLKDTSLARSLTATSIGLVAAPASGMRIKATIGRYYRVPTLMETFGYRGIALPNPLIKPEEGVNKDIGLVLRRNTSKYSFDLELAYFWSDVNDLIMYVFVPFAHTSQAINIDSARIKGLETSLVISTPFGISFGGNLTHLDAINTSPISYMHGKRLPNRPEIESTTEVRWKMGFFETYYQWNHISGNYWNAANTAAPNNTGAMLPVRNIHNVGLTVKPHWAVKISASVNNIANRIFEDVMGYPLPGRTSLISVEFLVKKKADG